jgi:hypothetical protein
MLFTKQINLKVESCTDPLDFLNFLQDCQHGSDTLSEPNRNKEHFFDFAKGPLQKDLKLLYYKEIEKLFKEPKRYIGLECFVGNYESCFESCGHCYKEKLFSRGERIVYNGDTVPRCLVCMKLRASTPYIGGHIQKALSNNDKMTFYRWLYLDHYPSFHEWVLKTPAHRLMTRTYINDHFGSGVDYGWLSTTLKNYAASVL